MKYFAQHRNYRNILIILRKWPQLRQGIALELKKVIVSDVIYLDSSDEQLFPLLSL